MAVASIMNISTPAAAAHAPPSCEVPTDVQSLFGLLDTLVFASGIGIATLGFLTAGVFLILSGQDNSRRGKAVAKNVLIGINVLLSVQTAVTFLASQLGVIICN